VNGNILLGEIKKLDYGQLTFKMEGMGTILVDVTKIKTLKSDKFFEFTTSHGRIIYGFIDSTNMDGMININSGYDSSNIHLYQIIQIYPIKNTFFLRTSGKINVGFNYTKASNVGRFNIDWNLSYRKKGALFTLTASNVKTFTPNDTLQSSSKYDFTLSVEKKIQGFWSWTGSLSGSQNTELGLDLRLKGGLGLVADVMHTNRQRFFGVIGVAPNLEVAQDKSSNTTNLEGQISASYQAYKFTTPEIHLDTRIDFYPSLNTAKRYRLDYNLDLNIEVFYNFFVGAKFYYNFDSKPASVDASHTDYGFTTTLGYSFH
tara:strand:+ start:59777 stop:60724 length:948 start_codon:yes stop_codon:yes gene_type:complete